MKTFLEELLDFAGFITQATLFMCVGLLAFAVTCALLFAFIYGAAVGIIAWLS